MDDRYLAALAGYESPPDGRRRCIRWGGAGHRGFGGGGRLPRRRVPRHRGRLKTARVSFGLTFPLEVRLCLMRGPATASGLKGTPGQAPRPAGDGRGAGVAAAPHLGLVRRSGLRAQPQLFPQWGTFSPFRTFLRTFRADAGLGLRWPGTTLWGLKGGRRLLQQRPRPVRDPSEDAVGTKTLPFALPEAIETHRQRRGWPINARFGSAAFCRTGEARTLSRFRQRHIRPTDGVRSSVCPTRRCRM
jgi:hypothetical protein